MPDFQEIDHDNIWHPFTPLQGAEPPILITSAKGVYLHASDGRAILDAISSWWVNLHGHSNPVISEAIAKQSATLEHVIFAGFTHEPAIELSQNLLSILPGTQKKIFFSDNGSTAVEVALKMAFQFWHNQDIRKEKIIAFKGAYHGDTFGSMSVAERGLFTKPFFPYLFETSFIDFPESENEEHVIRQFREIVDKKDVAAFIFEPLVQAASGMHMYRPEVLDRLISYAQQEKVICIADEVFTGFGRTGKTFATNYLDNQPDIIALSKGITGGFLPLGVTTCSEKIIAAFDSDKFDRTFFHGHSYTANPIACAAANASFKLLMDPVCRQRITDIANKHSRFATSLKGHKKISNVRSLGTILAIDIHSPEEKAYANSLRKRIYPFFLMRNILIRPLGNVIYVLPPYVMSNSELDRVYQAIEEFLASGEA